MDGIDQITRRLLLTASAGASGLLAFIPLAVAQDNLLKPTPQCDDRPTARQTEGPFFKPSSPQRSMLREPSGAGTPLRLTGLVVTRSCKPVPGALVDLWHTDSRGDYDNRGFRFRAEIIGSVCQTTQIKLFELHCFNLLKLFYFNCFPVFGETAGRECDVE